MNLFGIVTANQKKKIKHKILFFRKVAQFCNLPTILEQMCTYGIKKTKKSPFSKTIKNKNGQS